MILISHRGNINKKNQNLENPKVNTIQHEKSTFGKESSKSVLQRSNMKIPSSE